MSLRQVSDKDTESQSLSSFDDSDPVLAALERSQLRQMVHEHLIKHAKAKKIEKKTYTDLTEIVNEFLNCFILLGYNYSGEPVSLVTCKNQQQADSLGTLVQRFISTTPGPGDFTPPDDTEV